MENQDKRKTHTQGHESHGVHVCHKCGWPFPNPHPSAKHRRAHKKICGTIEGYKLLVSEGQIHSNASDDEHLSEDDHKTQGPNALDNGNDEKGSGGIGQKPNISGDEVFSDAVADFSDGGLSPGIKEPLRDSLDSSTDVETIHRKYPEFSGSSEDNGSNAADVSHLIAKSRNNGQMQNPKILQNERVEDGNMLELQSQQSGSTVDPLSSSIAALKTEELTVAHSNDCFGLSSDSSPSKYEIRAFSSNTIGERCEEVSIISVSDVVNSDCQVSDGAFNLKEKNDAELPSVMPQGDLTLEVNSTVSSNASTTTNDVQVELAHMIQFATSSNVKMLPEWGEGNVNVFTLPSCDDRPDMVHRQNEYKDFKDLEGVVAQNSLSLHSSEALEQERDYLKDSVAEENDFLINQSQLSEKREVLSQEMCALDSNMKKEQINCELMAEEMHAGESIGLSPAKFTVESNKRLYETGASTNAVKTEMNESHMVHFSEEQGSDDVSKNAQWMSLPEGSFVAASNENPSDGSFGSATSETSVINTDNISHHEKNITEINDTSVNDKCRGASVKNDIGVGMKTLQPSNLHLEVKPSSGVYKSDDAAEMGKIGKCHITDTQYFEKPIVKDTSLPATSNSESPILSEVVMDGSTRTPKGIECTNRGPLSGAQEDSKDDEMDSEGKVNDDCSTFAGTSTDSNPAQDAEQSVKATEGLDTQGGEPDMGVPGVIAVPVQYQSGNNEVKFASSAIYTSVDPDNRCGSLVANWGSVSALSMQSDAQAVINAEALPSADLLSSTEAGKFNMEESKASSETQQCQNPEIFEPPSFMTLVEPGYVIGPRAAAFEVQTGLNQQQPNPTSSQAGWFPTLTHITNESPGRKRNEEIIAKVTNSCTSKQTPLKSLLAEAAHSSKPKSPKLEEKSVNLKNDKFSEDNGSGLTTFNSILHHESPSDQAVKGESGKEWNSPARYPANIKREKKKVKSRPYWIQFVCCSSVDPR